MYIQVKIPDKEELKRRVAGASSAYGRISRTRLYSLD